MVVFLCVVGCSVFGGKPNLTYFHFLHTATKFLLVFGKKISRFPNFTTKQTLFLSFVC